MQPDRVPAIEPPDRPGQHMFAAVLLHMIEPARPVDFAVHRHASLGTAALKPVPYAARVGFNIAYARLAALPADNARIERLPAAGRIERAAVEQQPYAVAARFDLQRGRVERPQIRLVVIQSFRHLHASNIRYYSAKTRRRAIRALKMLRFSVISCIIIYWRKIP